MRPAPDPSSKAAYYEAALRGLRFVEQRAPTTRRFGADADARWAALRGHLTAADRIDLLLRDADAQWPSAFGARTVFGLRAVAEDDPFGAAWEPLDPVDAEDLLRRVVAVPAPVAVRAALDACAAAWGLTLRPVDLAPVAAADQLLLVGPGAVAAAALAFAAGADLDWSAQVVCVATPPAHRQIAALAAALLNASRPTPLFSPGEPARGLAAPHAAGRRLVLSDDADPADAAWASAA